jgi:glycosyltransferase involved in cell wall biosynthesis
MRKRIPFLFVGNFLQKSRGSVGIAQKMSNWFLEENVSFNTVSQYENVILRFIDIVQTILVKRPKRIFVDTYSGRAFLITVATFFSSKIVGSETNCVLRGGRLLEFYQNYPKLLRYILSRCNCYSPSLFLISEFKKEGFKITYLPNPVKLENFHFNRDTVKPQSLLWVRAFTSIYNPEVPIKLLSSLKEKYPDCTLTMIGPDRGLMDPCKKLANSLCIRKDISFLGSVPNNKLYRYYQSHSIYLNTTSYESFGVAMVEAASCGIPIVSNNVGEIPYLWEDKNSILLVEDNNIESYVDAVTQLFEDSFFASKMALSARDKAMTFNWNILKSDWLRLINGE